jgi:hypothetical protein
VLLTQRVSIYLSIYRSIAHDGDGKNSREEYNDGFVRLRSCDQSSTTTKNTGEEYNDGFDTMDLNKNGALSNEEVNCAIFSMLDTDGNGTLSTT